MIFADWLMDTHDLTERELVASSQSLRDSVFDDFYRCQMDDYMIDYRHELSSLVAAKEAHHLRAMELVYLLWLDPQLYIDSCVVDDRRLKAWSNFLHAVYAAPPELVY